MAKIWATTPVKSNSFSTKYNLKVIEGKRGIIQIINAFVKNLILLSECEMTRAVIQNP